MSLGKKNRLGNESVQVAYYRPFQGHIQNPGMGIISMAISDHMVTGYSADERALNDKKKPFKLTREMMKDVTELSYIDNIYIRVGWNDVQKRAGRLDLSEEFKIALDAACEAGKSWGFRIMQASPSNPREHLIPEFLENKLELCPYVDGAFYGPTPKKLPVYSDDYLKYWSEMLELLGEQFDSDPLLEYADISGYGLWGEGHHGCSNSQTGEVKDLILHSAERAEEVLKNLISSHRKAFVNTPAVLNLVWSNYEAGLRAIKDGCWVRRDSYYKWFQACEAQAGLCRRPDTAMIFETVMPGISEMALDTPDAMCDYGAAYGIIGFNTQDTMYAHRIYPQLSEGFKKRVGYRLRPSIIWKVKNQNGSWDLVMGMVNDGCANPPGDVTFYAACSKCGCITSVTINGGEFSRQMCMVKLPLCAEACGEVKLTMAICIGTKLRPARFAADVKKNIAPSELLINLDH